MLREVTSLLGRSGGPMCKAAQRERRPPVPDTADRGVVRNRQRCRAQANGARLLQSTEPPHITLTDSTLEVKESFTCRKCWPGMDLRLELSGVNKSPLPEVLAGGGEVAGGRGRHARRCKVAGGKSARPVGAARTGIVRRLRGACLPLALDCSGKDRDSQDDRPEHEQRDLRLVHLTELAHAFLPRPGRGFFVS